MVGFDFKNIKRLHVPGHMVVSFPAYVPVSTNKNILGLVYRMAVLEHHCSTSRNTNYCSIKVVFLCGWSLIKVVLYLESFIVQENIEVANVYSNNRL